MITLYHCAGARSFRVLWTLEAMGLPYELVTLPFPPRVLTKEFMGINPLGTVPYLVDGVSRMTESSAICHYLATRYGPSPLAVDVEEPDYANWLNALYQSDATLTFPQTLILRYGQFEPPERRSPQIVEDYTRWFLARLRWMDARLEEEDYVAANRFTVADIAVTYALQLAEHLGLLPQASPAVRSYWGRMVGRDCFARASRVWSPL